MSERAPRGWSGGQWRQTGGGTETRVWQHEHDPVEVTYNQETGDAVLIYIEGPDGGYVTEPLERVEDAGPSDPYRLMDRWNNGLVDPPFYHDSSSRDPPDFNVDDLDFS